VFMERRRTSHSTQPHCPIGERPYLHPRRRRTAVADVRSLACDVLKAFALMTRAEQLPPRVTVATAWRPRSRRAVASANSPALSPRTLRNRLCALGQLVGRTVDARLSREATDRRGSALNERVRLAGGSAHAVQAFRLGGLLKAVTDLLYARRSRQRAIRAARVGISSRDGRALAAR
jgi:hypothetical protein